MTRGASRVSNRLLRGIRGRRRQDGTAMVEFTLLLPFLLLLLFGILEFGLLFGRWLTLSNAAREGARVAVVFRSPCDAPTVETEAINAVNAYAASLGVTPDTVNVANECVSGGNVTVTVTKSYPFLVVSGFAQGLGPSLNLTATSTMRNEG